jgi:hypothetical protein
MPLFYPFTPPAVRLSSRKRSSERKRMMMGIFMMVEAACLISSGIERK